MAFVKHQLQAGWNPELCSIEDYMTGAFNGNDSQYSMSFSRAVDFALEKRQPQWSTKTYAGYKGAGKFFQEGAKEIGLATSPISEIKRRDIKLIAERAKAKYQWTNKSYNKYLGYLKALFSKVVEYEFIEMNPVTNIKPLPEAEDKHYEPLTREEKALIQEHLYLKHYRFYVYLMVIYYTGIRPKEVLSLKIGDIHSENSKTKQIRYVPINDHLFAFLRQMNLECYPKHYYVFGGVPKIKEKGKKGYYTAMDPNYFSPSLQWS